MGAEADAFHFHPYLIIWHYFSLKIKIICCILISKGSLNIFYVHLYKRAVYNLQAFVWYPNRDAFFCVFVFMRLRFFFAFAFFCVFVFLRFRSLKYASSFSEICVFVLWNMRLRSSTKRKRCQLSSGEYCMSVVSGVMGLSRFYVAIHSSSMNNYLTTNSDHLIIQTLIVTPNSVIPTHKLQSALDLFN